MKNKSRKFRTITFQPDPDVASKLFDPEIGESRGAKTDIINRAIRLYFAESAEAVAAELEAASKAQASGAGSLESADRDARAEKASIPLFRC